MKWLQKLGKALMLPVACLPICGILMGIGYLHVSFYNAGRRSYRLCGAVPQMIGFFLIKGGRRSDR